MKNVNVLNTFGITMNPWGLHKTLSIEKTVRMMDAWYLLTFTFLSKEVQLNKIKKNAVIHF